MSLETTLLGTIVEHIGNLRAPLHTFTIILLLLGFGTAGVASSQFLFKLTENIGSYDPYVREKMVATVFLGTSLRIMMMGIVLVLSTLLFFVKCFVYSPITSTHFPVWGFVDTSLYVLFLLLLLTSFSSMFIIGKHLQVKARIPFEPLNNIQDFERDLVEEEDCIEVTVQLKNENRIKGKLTSLDFIDNAGYIEITTVNKPVLKEYIDRDQINAVFMLGDFRNKPYFDDQMFGDGPKSLKLKLPSKEVFKSSKSFKTGIFRVIKVDKKSTSTRFVIVPDSIVEELD